MVPDGRKGQVMEEKESRLFIPQGLKPEREWYEGFGRKELMQAVYGSVGVILLTALVYILAGRMVYVVIMLLFGETGVLAMVTRSPVTNLSAFSQLQAVVRYWREQQHYSYRQMRE